MHSVLARQLRKLGVDSASPPDAATWQLFLERVERAYTEADQDRYTLERALDLSSAEMRKRFDALRAAQRQISEAARQAGRADVAASVLHNVGNVLNSLNVSTQLIGELVRGSARRGLTKTLRLLQGQSDLGGFLLGDPRGRKMLPFLVVVDEALAGEGEAVLREVGSLSRHVEHIKRIVQQQLSQGRDDPAPTNVVERVPIHEMVEDALTILQATFLPDSQIRVVRELESFFLFTDRHKVLQILANLLANARDALAERGPRGTIVVRARRVANTLVAIEVEDDGVGIAEEQRINIFESGFTTKSTGHGLGLHSAACAAMELAGRLRVESPGVGLGARFILELPDGRHGASEGNAAETFSEETS